MIKIIDYGLGNVRSFLNVYKMLNIHASLASKASDLKDGTRFILPGVGSFDYAMDLFQKSGMREPLEDLVLTHGKPVLGVCVGMQILSCGSEEGKRVGLSWIEGSVRKIVRPDGDEQIRLPHMGWNDVKPVAPSKLFEGLEDGARFYFLHSYYFKCKNQEAVLAEVDYKGNFTCAVHLRNIYGVQFHPEKSHQFGVRLLKNFSEVSTC